MKMEQRLHKRYPISLMVRLIIMGQVNTVAGASEICTKGMRVQNPGVYLYDGQKIIINFLKSGPTRAISYYAPATVIYSNSDEIGIMFESEISIDTLPGKVNVA